MAFLKVSILVKILLDARAGRRYSLFVCPSGQTKELRQAAPSLAHLSSIYEDSLVVQINPREGCERKYFWRLITTRRDSKPQKIEAPA